MILTPDQRLRVFVSSTMRELAPERAAVRTAIEQLHLVPVLFELGARPYPPRALYRSYLAQSHVFLGIYWQEYGWIAPDMDISGLEDELRLAADMPKLLYVKEPSPDRDPRLTDLIHEIEASGDTSYRVFSDADELTELVAADLALLLSEGFAATDSSKPEEDAEGVDAAAPPDPSTSFVGRQSELAELREMLLRDSTRLVTLVGPGGIGKSRLAIELSKSLHVEFPDGIYFVQLSRVATPDLVLAAIASTLGVRTDEQRSQHDGLVAAIGSRQILLILDNFEHVLSAAPAVGELLGSCPGLTVLVTSRRVLRLRGEYQYPVPPLPVPAAGLATERVGQVDGVRLFIDRARSAGMWDLPPAELEAVAEIVRVLDGVPLAIELAAARVRLLPPTSLVTRIGSDLGLLSGSFVDLPERQQSLRSTLDWSHDLLAPIEQRLFARLSSFGGSWTLEAAEAVCPEAEGKPLELIETMSALVESSLVQVDATDPSAPRFRMLRPVREYAREKLEQMGETADIDARHTAYFHRLCREASEQLTGPTQAKWLQLLELDEPNLAVSASRCIAAGDLEPLAESAWYVWIWIWVNDHITEARYWSRIPLEHTDEFDPLTAARLRWVVAALAYEVGEFDYSRDLLLDAQAQMEALDDDYGSALADMLLSALATAFGDVEDGVRRWERCLDPLREHGDLFSASIAGGSFAMFLALIGDPRAEGYMEQALSDAVAIGNEPMIGMTRLYQGFAALLNQEHTAAEAFLREIVASSGSRRSDEILAYGFEGLAGLALSRDQAGRAATLLGAAAGRREPTALSPWPHMQSVTDGFYAGARAALGDEAFDSAFEAGRKLARSEARRYALGEGTDSEAGDPLSRESEPAVP